MSKINAIRRAIHERLREDQSGFTLTELLMAVVISGIIVGALASAFLVGVKTTSSATTRLNESRDAQLATAYFIADASSASSFSTAAPAAGSCAAGMTNVVSFEWTDSVPKSVYYVVNGSPSKLVRRYCENDTLNNDVSLVKNLFSTSPLVVSCPPPEDPSCGVTAAPSDVQLLVKETTGYTYTLRASPRINSTTGGGLGGIAVYVGGQMDLKGNSIITANSGIVDVTGITKCAGVGSSVNAQDGFFGSGGGDCGQAAGSPPPDPLISLPDPAVPGTTRSDTTHPNATDCGSSQRTYQPGYYNTTGSSTLSSGCLASGVYYFDKAVTLNAVTSAPGGVLIYVKSGDLTLDGATTLSPMTTGSDAGVTIFMGRSNAGVIGTKSSLTLNGVTYGPAAEFQVISNNANVTVGGLDVLTLTFKGNSSGLVVI